MILKVGSSIVAYGKITGFKKLIKDSSCTIKEYQTPLEKFTEPVFSYL